MADIPHATPARTDLVARLAQLGLGIFRLFRGICSTGMGAAALATVGLLVICALFAPWIAPYDPVAINPRVRLQGPSWLHWLGTDQLGRDILSRLIHGAGTAMRVALLGTGGALAVGLALGLAAGYGPRWLDNAVMLLADSIKALPTIMFALAWVALYGPSLHSIIAIIIFSMAPGYFRVVRSQVLVLKRTDYVTAARAMGASPVWVAVKHLVPNLMGPIMVLIAMDVPAVIGIESGLSFLGQGVQPPMPSWGTMLSDGYAVIRQAPHLAIGAGMPIILATIGFTFLGESLRDVLDPKREDRR